MEKEKASYGMGLDSDSLLPQFPPSNRAQTKEAQEELFHVPETAVPTFNHAQEVVSHYHEDFKTDPQKALITISQERYILLRASALAFDFLNTLKNFYVDRGEAEAWQISRNLLFDLAHVIGINDARAFHKKMGVTERMEKVSMGPIHFAYMGWAIVEKAPDFDPQQEDFFFRFNHHYSFEADSWINSGRRSDVPVCIMSAGYSSGWCEESYGTPLTTVELTCKAQGHPHCSFVMAPPDTIEQCIEKYRPEFKMQSIEKLAYEIPTLFERKKIEEKLQQSNEELQRSNEELEQFAYVASHDLQEPLRMISSYSQLLVNRYQNKLDEDAKEFFRHTIDGTHRMQQLINDLLEYSRIGRKDREVEQVNVESILEQVLANLKLSIEEKGAEITHDPLPIISYPPRELLQLFQNLIGNALKFHGKEPPRLHIGVQDRDTEWVLSVRDNGIGIEQKYADRIFSIFQRLHTRQEYPGTGIGLSICKKIVERHKGKIWFESTVGKGSTFFFTVPKHVPKHGVS